MKKILELSPGSMVFEVTVLSLITGLTASIVAFMMLKNNFKQKKMLKKARSC